MNNPRFRRHSKNLASASDVLDRAFNIRGLAPKGMKQNVERYQAFSEWEAIAGDKFKSLSKPEKISRTGTLFVRVIDAVVAQEMALEKQHIIARYNSVSEGTYVQDLSFVIGSPVDFR